MSSKRRSSHAGLERSAATDTPTAAAARPVRVTIRVAAAVGPARMADVARLRCSFPQAGLTPCGMVFNSTE